MQPTCVLDFYVHESVQRNGVGKVHFLVKIVNFLEIFKNVGKRAQRTRLRSAIPQVQRLPKKTLQLV